MGDLLIIPKSNDIVRKSESLVKARYSLNPLALKFVTTIISNLKRSDEVDKEYIYRVKDFAEMMGVSYHDIYAEMEEAVEELLKKPLHIKTDDGWIKANWISDAEYKEGEGYISFTISKKLRPYLLAVQEKFLKYRIENILKLKSGYVIRLYEILKDWYNQSERYNGTKKVEKIVEVRWLREILEIPKSYQYSSHLKKLIIEKAKKQLAEHTDIKFDYKEIKTGRKVTHIKFIIEDNSKAKAAKEKQEKKKIEYEQDDLATLEAELNKRYKGYYIINQKDGLRWFVDKIKLKDRHTAIVEFTNMSDYATKELPVEKLENIFTKMN